MVKVYHFSTTLTKPLKRLSPAGLPVMVYGGVNRQRLRFEKKTSPAIYCDRSSTSQLQERQIVDAINAKK